MPDFLEVADRVWVARYDWFDVNVTLIGGERGLVVVDTHSSSAAAREVIADARRLGAGEIVGIVNTHAHFDHAFGNHAFRAAYGPVPIHAHENAAEELPGFAERTKQEYADDAVDPNEISDPRRDEIAATEVVLPDHTFSSVAALDLGDRAVELLYPGRGHTSGDLLVRVPDADVMLAGDLLEESAPPAVGRDSWPMEWPLSLDMLLSLTTSRSVIVPGHGTVVDRDFAELQRNQIGIVAETIRDLAGRGVPVDQAVAAADWPFPAESLEIACRRGYEQLPRSQKRLPLI